MPPQRQPVAAHRHLGVLPRRLAQPLAHRIRHVGRHGPAEPRRPRPKRRRGDQGDRRGRRRRAGQRLVVAGIVGEAHRHLDRLALVRRHQRVGARRRLGDGRLGGVVHPDPLVRVADAGQPVGIHDGGGDRRQRLPDLRRARDRRRARRKVVVRRRDGRRRLAGQRLGVAGVVGEAHPHRDRHALVVRHQRVGARRRPGDVRLSVVGGHPDPLEAGIGVRKKGVRQPVHIHDVTHRRRQRLPDLRRARDRRRARRGGVGRRRDDRRRLAGQRLGVAGVVGEAHRHLDRHALVVRHQRVGACRRLGDGRVSVVGGHPDPLEAGIGVRKKGVRQPVHIHDVTHRRRQRLPDLRRARDRRRARRGGVGRRRDDRRRLAGQRLGVAGVVGEAHRHLDRHALVVRHQRVGACRRLGDGRVSVVGGHPDPLEAGIGVRKKGVRQPVHIHDVTHRRRQRLPDLRRARDRRRARRGGVGRRRDDRRRLAGQRLGVAGVVGEAHRHLDRHALVVRHQRVGACRRLGDGRVSVVGGHPDPLEAGIGVRKKGVRQPVHIHDVTHRRRQRLPDLRRARDRRRARRGGVGRRRDDRRRLAGQRLGVAGVVGEAHRHLDRHALVVRHQRVGARRRPGDVRLSVVGGHPDPLEAGIGVRKKGVRQPVHIHDVTHRRRQRLPDLRRARDRRRARRGGVGRRRDDRRRLAGQRLGVAGVVGEAHRHLDRHALVVRHQRVGARRRPGDVRLSVVGGHPDPLEAGIGVRKKGVRQPVHIHDVTHRRRQRLPDLRRARDRRRARRGGVGRRRDDRRRLAGQRLGVAGVVGEAHRHLDRHALVVRHQRVGARRRPGDVRLSVVGGHPDPLEAGIGVRKKGVRQPVHIHDVTHRRRQRLPDLRRARDRRRARRGGVGRRRDDRRRLAGQRLGVAGVVGEAHRHLDRHALVVRHQRVGARRRPGDVRLSVVGGHPDPLEAGIGVRKKGVRQPVHIHDVTHRRRQRLPDLRRARDRRRARRGGVGRRRDDRRRLAGQRLGVAGVVGEAHRHLDRHALVVRHQRVGARRRPGDVRLSVVGGHPDPLEAGIGVRKKGVRQPVHIHDVTHRRRQRLPDLRRARDRRRARRGGVGRRRDDRRRLAGQRLGVAGVVGEAHRHLDRHALVVRHQRVGARRRPGDVRLSVVGGHPDPLEAGIGVRKKGVRQPVHIHDVTHRRRQRLPDLRRARDRRRARRGGVGRRDGRRRRAGQRLAVLGVVGEAHLYLDRRAQVVRHQRVGARHRPDVRIAVVGGHPDPLVRVADAGQPVGIHDAGGARRQRLPDLRRAGDRRPARRGGVRRRRDGRRRHAGQRLAVAGIVGEAHPHLDPRVLVRRHQRVGPRRRPVDHSGPPDPLVHVVDVFQPVGIHDGGGDRRQRLPDLRRAGDRRPARRGHPACPPDLEAEGAIAGSPEVIVDVVLRKRVAEAPSHCRAGVQGLVGQADPKPLAIGRGEIPRDHPVGRAGTQRDGDRGREGVDGVIRERFRIGQEGHRVGARIAPAVPVNLDRPGDVTGLRTKIYPDAGQLVGAGARGERYGLNQV